MPALDLTKKVETVGLNLQKFNITNVPKCAVKAALDISGSMSGLYANGSVQKTFEQLLAFAMKFDDNGEIDMYAFDTRCHPLEVASERGYQTYIRENIQRKFGINGGTKYSPTFQKIIEDAKPQKKLLGSTPAFPPTVVLFFTDGANEQSDESAADRAIREASQQKLPVYFHLVGVGNNDFKQCKKLAEDYDNCGFVQVRSVGLNDDEMYKALITSEFTDFLRLHGAN